jgi:hypothetical protein
MGIIVSEEYINNYGSVANVYYVNIDNIVVSKAHLDDFKYNIRADRNLYMSKQVRDDNKLSFETDQVMVLSNTVNDIHGQVYTQIKTQYQYVNYTDDI